MKYYWCCNCGFHGEFKILRQKNIKCECCGYDYVVGFTKSEWLEEGYDKKHKDQVKSKYYKDMLNGKNKGIGGRIRSGVRNI